MIIHLEPDILEWKVKWGLGSITTNKACGGDGIPAKLFQILKDEWRRTKKPLDESEEESEEAGLKLNI